MSYIIRKTTVKEYEIKQLCINFFKDIDNYIQIRQRFKRKMTSCFNCKRHFSSDKDAGISLAITSKGNVVLCNPCAEEIYEQNDGSIEITRKP